MQQAIMRDFIQGSECGRCFEVGYPAQVLKGTCLSEDSSCRQKGKGVRRELVEPCTDDFAHTGGEEAAYHHLMAHGCLKVNAPSSLVVRAGGKDATFEQDLERLHEIERLPLRFRKQPLTKAFQVRRSPPVLAC